MAWQGHKVKPEEHGQMIKHESPKIKTNALQNKIKKKTWAYFMEYILCCWTNQAQAFQYYGVVALAVLVKMRWNYDI